MFYQYRYKVWKLDEIKRFNKCQLRREVLDLFSREEQPNTAVYYVKDLELLVDWWSSRNPELHQATMREF